MRLLDVKPGALVGKIIANKYLIERELAGGGQGVVVLARHLRLPKLVAIKLPRYLTRPSSESTARMLREGRAAFRISSEHVARVIDVDVLDGVPFIVMEYLIGADLSAVIAERGRLSVDEGLGFVLQACEAVAEAHQLGIVHRDLKPSNLFLCRRRNAQPMVKVLDFGLSKAVESVSEDGSFGYSTEPLRVMGSARYMSPEQAAGLPTVDSRTDVWSLGTILYELLAGVPAFKARTRAESLARVLTENPTPLSSLRPDAPLAIDSAIQRCLRKPLGERLATVRDLVAELAPYAPPWAKANVERVLSSRTPLGDVATGEEPKTVERHEATTAATMRVQPRKRFGPAWLACLVVVAAVLAWQISRPHQSNTRESTSASASLPPAAGPARTSPSLPPTDGPRRPVPAIQPLAIGAARNPTRADRVAPLAVHGVRVSHPARARIMLGTRPAAPAAATRPLGPLESPVVSIDPLEGRR